MTIYNILCATDDNYVPDCGIMLTSLFENNKDKNFNIYIQCGSIREENIARLQTLGKIYRSKINIVKTETADLPPCPIRKGDHVSIAAYYRLLCPEMFPKEVEKILYLDCDIIVNDKIDDLYNLDICNYAYGAVVDEDNENKEKHTRLGYSSQIPYFNGGVLLINLKYWRENNVTKRCFQHILENPNKIILHDQDTLNAVLNKEVKLLSVKYNLQTAMLCRNTSLNTDTKLEIEKYKYQPTIIHYTGTSKPWQKGSIHPYTKRFLRYKQLSLWSGHPLTKVNRTFLELMLHIRNSIIWFIGLKKRPKTYIIEAQD